MNKYLFIFIISCSAIASKAQNLGGIGAQLILDTAGGHTMPRIMSLVPGTPADSFLKATDFIYTVNGISCKDKTIEEVVGLIRGEIGTTVKVTVTDTKEGKRPRNYELTRRGVPGIVVPPPADPLTAFNDWCDKQAEQLKANKQTIIKTFNTACAADRFFNFVAEARTYHIVVYTLEEHTAGVNIFPKVRAFDNDNEALATEIKDKTHQSVGEMAITQIAGTVAFTKACVGVVNVKIDGHVDRCHGLYVIIYR